MPSRGRADVRKTPAFLPDTADIRESDWVVAAAANADGAQRLAGLEGHRDARDRLKTLVGHVGKRITRSATVRVIVVVDTVSAAFELEEILYELKDLAVALEFDPSGYLFSYIKAFSDQPECVLPDRADMTPTTHCLRSCVRHMVDVGARRHAPVLGDVGGVDYPLAGDDRVVAADLLQVPRGRITERGIRDNIRIVIQYAARILSAEVVHADSQLRGERTEAELSRSQLWQWVHQDTGVLDSGRIITGELVDAWITEELEGLAESSAGDGLDPDALDRGAQLLRELTRADTLAPILTSEAYPPDE